jgi:hypothetical protein
MRTSRREILVHGVIAAAIGYAVVTILFGVVDFLLGRPAFATAAYVGARVTPAVFEATPFDPAPVVAFNALHIALLLVAGLLGSFLVHRSSRAGVLPLFAFSAGVVATLLAAFALAAGLLGAVCVVDLVWINLAAAAAGASYLLVRMRLPPRPKPA